MLVVVPLLIVAPLLVVVPLLIVAPLLVVVPVVVRLPVVILPVLLIPFVVVVPATSNVVPKSVAPATDREPPLVPVFVITKSEFKSELLEQSVAPV